VKRRTTISDAEVVATVKMITPRFTLDQDDRQLIITIFAPYTNVKDTEIHVHEDDVRFFSKPYYLR